MKRRDDYLRRLYEGARPNRSARLQNRASAIAFGMGIWPSRLAALEVRGRRSGRTISSPIVIADHDGERYLVSMLGEKSNWVRNVRAADGRAVLRHGRREDIRLEEVAVQSRPAILRRYLGVAPGARPHIPVDRHASLREFERIAPQFPVFRLTPRDRYPLDPGEPLMDTTKSPLKREFWRPEEHKFLVRRQPRWGWGWTINFAELARRVRERR